MLGHALVLLLEENFHGERPAAAAVPANDRIFPEHDDSRFIKLTAPFARPPEQGLFSGSAASNFQHSVVWSNGSTIF
jgi:hypothetical protein